MILSECSKFNNCERIKLIKTIDTDKYDIDSLIQDICWLCDEKANKRDKIGQGGKSLND